MVWIVFGDIDWHFDNLSKRHFQRWVIITAFVCSGGWNGSQTDRYVNNYIRETTLQTETFHKEKTYMLFTCNDTSFAFPFRISSSEDMIVFLDQPCGCPGFNPCRSKIILTIWLEFLAFSCALCYRWVTFIKIVFQHELPCKVIPFIKKWTILFFRDGGGGGVGVASHAAVFREVMLPSSPQEEWVVGGQFFLACTFFLLDQRLNKRNRGRLHTGY